MTRPHQLEIGPARAHELVALAALEVRADALFATVGLDALADDDPRPVAEFVGIQRAGELLVARLPHGPVGFAALLRFDAGLHLEELSVDPEFGRRGIGSRLLEAVFDIARAWDQPAVTLTTYIDVPWNGPMYRRRGFAPLPEAEWTPDLRAKVSHEVALGLHLAPRWVMRRPVGG